MNELREYNFDDIFFDRIRMRKASTRDESAIKKIFSGAVKLLFPDGKMCDDELRMILDYAIEIRQFVLDQIYNIYQNRKFDRIINYEIRG